MKNVKSPMATNELKKRGPIYTKGKKIKLCEFYHEGIEDLRIVKEDDWYSIVGVIDHEGIRSKRRYEKIPAEIISKKNLKKSLKAELDGFIPKEVPLNFEPKQTEYKAKDFHKTKNTDKGGAIFGDDDRYLFNDRSFPWRTTGLIRTANGFCSGTTIGSRHVLTASHCVDWDRNSNGEVGWITFTPGYFDGIAPWGEIAATRVLSWIEAPGSLTDQQTAFDYVVLILEEPIGDIVGYPGYRTYSSNWNGGTFWQYIGYPGELSGGQKPAFQGDCVVSSVSSHNQSGQQGFVMGHFNEFTPGQSGGCLWGWWDGEPWPRVVGVGSTIGSTTVQTPSNTTNGDNEYGGGDALSALISWARDNY